jgi:hypothetical protein
MCELLALSANTPTDMQFSFRGLARRGGETGVHGDGWGLASFDPAGGALTIYREEAAAALPKKLWAVDALYALTKTPVLAGPEGTGICGVWPGTRKADEMVGLVLPTIMQVSSKRDILVYSTG